MEINGAWKVISGSEEERMILELNQKQQPTMLDFAMERAQSAMKFKFHNEYIDLNIHLRHKNKIEVRNIKQLAFI